jgi:hypothetical protein
MFAGLRENGVIFNFLRCDSCFRDQYSKRFRLIDYGAADLETGTDQKCSTYDILIICGDFAGGLFRDVRPHTRAIEAGGHVGRE